MGDESSIRLDQSNKVQQTMNSLEAEASVDGNGTAEKDK